MSEHLMYEAPFRSWILVLASRMGSGTLPVFCFIGYVSTLACTALHVASFLGNVGMIQLLLPWFGLGLQTVAEVKVPATLSWFPSAGLLGRA